MTDSRHLLDDLQASIPEVRIGLSRAGVRGVSKAIRLRWGDAEKLIAAEIDCTVDLDRAQKGVHMSRFPELFEEAIEEVVIGRASSSKGSQRTSPGTSSNGSRRAAPRFRSPRSIRSSRERPVRGRAPRRWLALSG